MEGRGTDTFARIKISGDHANVNKEPAKYGTSAAVATENSWWLKAEEDSSRKKTHKDNDRETTN